MDPATDYAKGQAALRALAFPTDAKYYTVQPCAVDHTVVGIGWLMHTALGTTANRPCFILGYDMSRALVRPAMFTATWDLAPCPGEPLRSLSFDAPSPHLVWGLAPPTTWTARDARLHLRPVLPLDPAEQGDPETTVDRLAAFLAMQDLPRGHMESFWIRGWLLARVGA